MAAVSDIFTTRRGGQGAMPPPPQIYGLMIYAPQTQISLNVVCFISIETINEFDVTTFCINM
jgi:hypothetical protein